MWTFPRMCMFKNCPAYKTACKVKVESNLRTKYLKAPECELRNYLITKCGPNVSSNIISVFKRKRKKKEEKICWNHFGFTWMDHNDFPKFFNEWFCVVRCSKLDCRLFFKEKPTILYGKNSITSVLTHFVTKNHELLSENVVCIGCSRNRAHFRSHKWWFEILQWNARTRFVQILKGEKEKC